MTRNSNADCDMAEYEQLKEEQRSRIGFRDNLLYATLAAMGAVGFAAIQTPSRPALLLLLPGVTYALGWNYIANDRKVTAIGNYIQGELATRLGGGRPVFGWESSPHRTGTGRTSRKVWQLTVDLAVFVVAPLAAIFIFWALGEPNGLLLSVSLFEVAAPAATAYQIVRHADLLGRPRPRA